MSALWTVDDMAAAMRADRAGALPADVTGISIDSRSIAQAAMPSSPSRATIATAMTSSTPR